MCCPATPKRLFRIHLNDFCQVSETDFGTSRFGRVSTKVNNPLIRCQIGLLLNLCGTKPKLMNRLAHGWPLQTTATIMGGFVHRISRWRLGYLLPLSILISCSDNAVEPNQQAAGILGTEMPDRVTVDRPQPYIYKAELQLPLGLEESYQLWLELVGPDGGDALSYQLHDDGSAFTISNPGPGQAEISGDNVPGDGVYTARIAPSFSNQEGEFGWTLRLYENGDQISQRIGSLSRLPNELPVLFDANVPAALDSGTGLVLGVKAYDPDGEADLTHVLMELGNPAAPRVLELTAMGDSLFSLTTGPEVAAGFQGETALRLVAEDLTGARSELELSIDLENTPPVIHPGSLEMYQRLDSEPEYQQLLFEDVIHMYVPSTSPEDSVYYQMRLPIDDLQGQGDIVSARWQIEATANPDVVLTVDMIDLEGEGIWVGNFSLVGRPEPYTYTHYALRFMAEDPFGQTQSEDYTLQIHNLEGLASRGRDTNIAFRPLADGVVQ